MLARPRRWSAESPAAAPAQTRHAHNPRRLFAYTISTVEGSRGHSFRADSLIEGDGILNSQGQREGSSSAEEDNCLLSEENEEDIGSPHRLRERAAPTKSGLKSPHQLRKPQSGIQKRVRKGMRGQWSDESLKLAIDALDQGYKMVEVSRKYEIPKPSLRDHYEGRTRNRKRGPKTILSKEEEEKLVEYIELMVHWGHPMTPMQVKSKVAEIT